MCWCRKVEGKPWCELCIHHLTSKGSDVALAVMFLFASLGIVAVGIRWQLNRSEDPGWLFWAVVGAGGVLGSVYIGVRDRPEVERKIEVRTDDELPIVLPSASIGHPYRAALRRAARIAASPVSGRWTAALLIACMTVVAVTLPWLLRLPRWIEAEIVLCLWWAAWAAVLTTLLYRGWHISDDHVLAAPVFPWTGRTKSSGKVGPDGCLEVPGCGEVTGCGEALAALLLLIATFVAAWLVVELVFPALFFLSYLLVRGALARVTNDDHGCKGRLPIALAWGTIWATVYALPLTLAVYGVHRWVGQGLPR